VETNRFLLGFTVRRTRRSFWFHAFRETVARARALDDGRSYSSYSFRRDDRYQECLCLHRPLSPGVVVAEYRGTGGFSVVNGERGGVAYTIRSRRTLQVNVEPVRAGTIFATFTRFNVYSRSRCPYGSYRRTRVSPIVRRTLAVNYDIVFRVVRTLSRFVNTPVVYVLKPYEVISYQTPPPGQLCSLEPVTRNVGEFRSIVARVHRTRVQNNHIASK